jgi:hypothetical protein
LAVVIKGTSCAGAGRLAAHLARKDTNERVEVGEIRGVAAEELRGALVEMEALGAGTRSTKPFYHASINTRADERLTDQQRTHAIDKLETALGLSGQPRVVVVHEKESREHCHIVWSRIDVERLAAISDSHNYRKHEQVARDLERAFGHERVQGAHIEREGKQRPKRTPSHADMLQAERTGLSVKTVKGRITELWRRADSGQAFAAALTSEGYMLARGDRRDFVVIDPRGGTHSLARRVEGARVKDIRERMRDLDPTELPSVTEARQSQRPRLHNGMHAHLAVKESRKALPNGLPRTSGGSAGGTFKGTVARPSDIQNAMRRTSGQIFRRSRAWHLSIAKLDRGKKSYGPRRGRTVGLSPNRFRVRRLGLYAELLRPAAHAHPSETAAVPAPPSKSLLTPNLSEQPTAQKVNTHPATEAQAANAEPHRPMPSGQSDSGGENGELADALDAIAEEVQRHCAAICEAIATEFAGRKAHARKCLPKDQVAAAIAALNDLCRSAIAAAQRQAKAEIASRSHAAKMMYRRRPRPPPEPPKLAHSERRHGPN